VNIIPFDTNKGLPAFLKNVNVADINADLLAHAGGGFPVVSIKGKHFTIVRGDEREKLMNPKDPESAATSIDVVLLKANKVKSKVFYIKGYDPKESEGKKPDCFSNDGVAPDAQAEHKQAKSCATCPHNQWGSKISDNGSKGKACQDSVRMAIAAAGQVNDPMLLRVPPASIKGLAEYGQMLAKRGVGYNMVVTKISFDLEAESPKLVFKPVGFLDDASYQEVLETLDSSLVADILGASIAPAAEPAAEADPLAGQTPPKAAAPAPAPTKTVTEDEVQAAVEAAAPAPAPAPRKRTAAPAPAPAPVVDDDIDLDLDGISFDD
jgi:hypothetical protein